jgi:hypothetical protein
MVYLLLAFSPVSHMHSTSLQCVLHDHLMLLDVIVLIVLGEEDKSRGCSLCSPLDTGTRVPAAGPARMSPGRYRDPLRFLPDSTQLFTVPS